MRFDDPYIKMREFFRQFDRMRELGRSPFDDINRHFREQRQLFQDASLQLTSALEQAATARPLISESQRLLESMALSADSSLSDVTRAREEIARSWDHYADLYRAPEVIDPAGFRLEVDPARAALESLRRDAVSSAQSLIGVQDSLRAEILNAPTLAESLAAIKLEQELGSLYHRLETPGLGSALDDFRATVLQLRSASSWPRGTIKQLGVIAGELELPSLRNAALQWSVLAQEALGPAVGSVPLFETTLSTITSLARESPLQNFSRVVELWGNLVESEASRAEGRRISPRVAAYLLNVLLFLLGLFFQHSGTEKVIGRIERLSNDQASTAAKLEELEEAEYEAREERAEEIAFIRQVLEMTEAHRRAPEVHTLRVSTENLRLHASPSLDSDVLMIVPKGNTVEVLDEEGTWCKVRVFNFATKETVEGWVASQFLLDWSND